MRLGWLAGETELVTGEPVAIQPGATLRFRIEDPRRGVENSTWSVVSSKRSKDLYVSARQITGDLKLSLHESGITWMAWTPPAAASRLAGHEDRVLSRWTEVQQLASGRSPGDRLETAWSHAITVESVT